VTVWSLLSSTSTSRHCRRVKTEGATGHEFRPAVCTAYQIDAPGIQGCGPTGFNSCIENVCLYRRSCWIWHIYSHIVLRVQQLQAKCVGPFTLAYLKENDGERRPAVLGSL
jgi:hypothetical protein